MDSEGLRQPTEVRRRAKKEGRPNEYILISGGHRLAAFGLLEKATIPAFVFDCTAEEARLAEIDENLIRHDLNPLDRAMFLHERQAVYLKLYPETGAGVAGAHAKHKKDATANLAIAAYDACFAADVRNKTGMSDRTVRRAVSIASKLAPDVRVRLAGTDTGKKQSELEALIKLSQAEQRAVADLILSGKVKTVAAAAALAAGTPEVERDEDSQKFDKLVNLWGRCGQKIRLKFIDLLRQDDLDDLLAALPPPEDDLCDDGSEEIRDEDGLGEEA